MQFRRATHQVAMRNRRAAVDVSDTEDDASSAPMRAQPDKDMKSACAYSAAITRPVNCGDSA